MIIGIGIDVVSVSRMSLALSRCGERLPRRLLSERELVLFAERQGSPHFLASRFAAREAAAKAFGTGIGARLGWRDLEVSHDRNGAPSLVLHGRALVLVQQLGITHHHLSLSDERDLVLAAVIF